MSIIRWTEKKRQKVGIGEGTRRINRSKDKNLIVKTKKRIARLFSDRKRLTMDEVVRLMRKKWDMTPKIPIEATKQMIRDNQIFVETANGEEILRHWRYD